MKQSAFIPGAGALSCDALYKLIENDMRIIENNNKRLKDLGDTILGTSDDDKDQGIAGLEKDMTIQSGIESAYGIQMDAAAAFTSAGVSFSGFGLPKVIGKFSGLNAEMKSCQEGIQNCENTQKFLNTECSPNALVADESMKRQEINPQLTDEKIESYKTQKNYAEGLTDEDKANLQKMNEAQRPAIRKKITEDQKQLNDKLTGMNQRETTNYQWAQMITQGLQNVGTGACNLVKADAQKEATRDQAVAKVYDFENAMAQNNLTNMENTSLQQALQREQATIAIQGAIWDAAHRA